ncbi:MAG: hypothetical protein R3304_05345, partial [Longimicrobiales bacterium]|nr:hypothetical protein [Longimicrobiales bacterium]
MTRSHPCSFFLAVLLAVGLGACVDEESRPITAPQLSVVDLDAGPAEDFRVYTQNMWLGGETGPLFSLPLTDPNRFGDVIQAVNVFWAQVRNSDVPGRAVEFVDEIEKTLPHVVGLQEATGYATGDLDLGTFSFTPTAPGPDLLGSVMQELAARGLPYEIGMMQPTTAVALPLGPPDVSGVAPALGVQDRVVMLVHRDAEIVHRGRGVFTARIPLAPGIDILRGWVRVTMERNGTPYHFIATHLEGQGDGPGSFQRQIHNAQADQLLDVVVAGLGG